MNKLNNKRDLCVAFSLHVLNLEETMKKLAGTAVVLSK
jgi:hypothetical protein